MADPPVLVEFNRECQSGNLFASCITKKREQVQLLLKKNHEQ